MRSRGIPRRKGGSILKEPTKAPTRYGNNESESFVANQSCERQLNNKGKVRNPFPDIKCVLRFEIRKRNPECQETERKTISAFIRNPKNPDFNEKDCVSLFRERMESIFPEFSGETGKECRYIPEIFIADVQASAEFQPDSEEIQYACDSRISRRNGILMISSVRMYPEFREIVS